MRILVSVRQLGRKKAALIERPVEIRAVQNLADLIRELVRAEVRAYQARTLDDPGGDAVRTLTLLTALSAQEIEDQAAAGKVGFGLRYNERPVDPDQAAETALLAFTDGLYRVFLDDQEVAELDAPLKLAEDQRLTFIRLTMLAGRLW